jgi:DNA-3-methyladenine glycosylase I
MHNDVKQPCSWVGNDPLMLQYHDREWDVPVHDDRKHFEFLVLEGAQAGLSWTIVLKKREGYRRAFDASDPEKVARFSARRIEKLASDSGIIRNHLKIEPRLATHVRFSKSRKSSKVPTPTAGVSLMASQSLIGGRSCNRFLQLLTNPMLSAKT